MVYRSAYFSTSAGIAPNSLMALTDYNEILDKAKAMEKEQIIEAVESTIKSVKLTFCGFVSVCPLYNASI